MLMNTLCLSHTKLKVTVRSTYVRTNIVRARDLPRGLQTPRQDLSTMTAVARAPWIARSIDRNAQITSGLHDDHAVTVQAPCDTRLLG